MSDSLEGCLGDQTQRPVALHLEKQRSRTPLPGTAETVIAWAKAGLLRASRTPGGHYRFDPAEVQALMSADPLTFHSGDEVTV